MLKSERSERTATLARLAAMTDSTSEDQRVIDKIDKLFKQAGGTNNQHEAETFLAKAQELMEQHGLSQAAINEGASTKKASRRTDEKLAGGLYQFQRDLWEAVAQLNFCWYFHTKLRDPNKVSKYWIRQYGGIANVPEYRRGGFTFQHRLVGRAVNVAATISMCSYLEQTMERLVRERLEVKNHAVAETKRDEIERYGRAYAKEETLWGEFAVAYRTGIADTVCEKLAERRRGLIREERQKMYEAQQRDADAAGAKFSSSTALTLGTLTEQEHAENFDFLYGEGEYAKEMAKRAARAERQRIAEEEHAKWAAENPEEAAAQEEARRKENRRYGHTPWNAGMGKSKYDSGGYHDGRRAGRNISLDAQMGGGAVGRLEKK